MRTLARLASAVALVGIVAPAIAYLGGALSLAAVKTWMLAFTILWFVSAPCWMGRKDPSSSSRRQQ